ncbi:NERD domain-containing protein [Nitrosomonadales bacterium]|nr:NERD domain-containing protein [Nitrosomonadales bacterium]
MKLIPNIYRNNNSNAEKKVFNLFRDIDLGPGWTAFHSLNISESDYKLMCEADFVLLGPRGLFIFEVKGGRIRRENGIWYYKDRYSVEHKSSEGPFKQAINGMYALQKKINTKKLSIGYGVIFPDVSFNENSPEWPDESVCDDRFTKDKVFFKKYLIRLIDYWVGKQNRRELLSNDPVLSQIINKLRPDFDHSPSLFNKLVQEDKEINKHTEEQYLIIDAIEDNERIICTGGAGTGKSFLAVEITRRELFKQKSVILLVMEELFATYLKSQLADELKDKNYILNICSKLELKELLNSIETQFDVLIVDEGQDLMSAENMDIMDSALKNGLSNGKWRYFMDPNKQAGVVGCFDDEAYEIMKSYNHTSHKLSQNCRNTKQIVSQAEFHTGASIGDPFSKNTGKSVIHCDVIDQEDELNEINKILGKWVGEEDIPLSDIAILSPLQFSDSIASKLDKRWRKRIQEISQNNVMLEDNKILFSTIKNFKGLERMCIILVDTEKIKDMKNPLATLYIALTRARTYLWIASSKEFKEYLSFNLKQRGLSVQ